MPEWSEAIKYCILAEWQWSGVFVFSCVVGPADRSEEKEQWARQRIKKFVFEQNSNVFLALA